ncbi:MAG: STAS domain-containing protein [Candidatus Aquicultorales bacterium]
MNDDDFNYKVVADDGRLTVQAQGDLDIYSVERLDQSLEEWLVGECKGIVFDCEHVDFVDSSFLRYLMSLKKQYDDIVVINASRTVLRILEISGLDKVFLG